MQEDRVGQEREDMASTRVGLRGEDETESSTGDSEILWGLSQWKGAENGASLEGFWLGFVEDGTISFKQKNRSDEL